jgi:hypothetical protein
VAQLVETLRYKLAGRGFDSRWCGFFHWHNPVGRTMALGSTQPLTEMSTGNISWGVNAAGAYGWQPTTFKCRLSRNLGASTSWNPGIAFFLFLKLGHLNVLELRSRSTISKKFTSINYFENNFYNFLSKRWLHAACLCSKFTIRHCLHRHTIAVPHTVWCIVRAAVF